MTLALSQVVGLIILGPLTVKLIGVDRALVALGILYGVAALLVSQLPKDKPQHDASQTDTGWSRVKDDLKEGANFVLGRPQILVTMMHLTLVASLVMILAMLAPGIASRVLHLAPEDAMVVFAPAGLGMLLAALFLGRWGTRVPRQRMVRYGLVASTFSFAAFGWVAWQMVTTGQRFVLNASVVTMPPASAALILSIVLCSLLLGLSVSSVNIVSQTSLQEGTPEDLRGRVFSVQFMLNNLVGIPPMLAIGALADVMGIPQVLFGISLMIAGVLAITIRVQRQYGVTAVTATIPSGESPGRSAEVEPASAAETG